MNPKNLLKKSALATVIALLTTNAYSAGFQLNEYSSAGLGRAFSGESAIADNATAGSRNPATMTLFKQPTVSAGLIFIDPDIDVHGKSHATGSSLKAKNIAPTEWIPNLHFIYPINEQWAVGASATTNFGLSTDFNHNYPAGPLAGKTKLLTSNLNFSAAYRLDQHFSFGLGVNAVYADAKISRYAGESSLALNQKLPPSMATKYDTKIADLKGDAWGFGVNAGLLYELSKDSRFGLSYRSKVDIDFDGKYRSQLPSVLNPQQAATGLPYGTDGQRKNGSLRLRLPELWELSAYQKVAPKWAMHSSLAYSTWHRFKELKAKNKGDTLFYKKEGFKDAYRLSLGTTYYHNDNWTFRSGIAFDDSPIPAKHRSISIPDQDRIWFSAGTTYAFNKDASVDVGISYMHGKSVNFEENGYNFHAKGKAWLYGANFNYTF